MNKEWKKDQAWQFSGCCTADFESGLLVPFANPCLLIHPVTDVCISGESHGARGASAELRRHRLLRHGDRHRRLRQRHRLALHRDRLQDHSGQRRVQVWQRVTGLPAYSDTG